MLNFKEWLTALESSPLTRRRHDAARGLMPPMADHNSRSTPTPWEGEENERRFKATKKKPKKKR